MNKKQIKITGDLVARSLHYLDELDLPYALVIEGVDIIFSNRNKRYAATLLGDAWNLQDKIYELENTEKAEKMNDNYGKQNNE